MATVENCRDAEHTSRMPARRKTTRSRGTLVLVTRRRQRWLAWA
uniref:Uncharacterized protein n=1 Tax=Arundo donax TaxID=35708 RepID=A0A0A9AY26_ARUDO